jgi:hypothetical protein
MGARVFKLRHKTTTQWAQPDAVADTAKEWPEEFLLCRTYGHSWRPFGAEDNADGTIAETLRCSSCRGLKTVDILPTTGVAVTTPRYSHEEGYLTQGMGRIGGDGRGALRLEVRSRLRNVQRKR